MMRPRHISTPRGGWEIGMVVSQTGPWANVGRSQLEGAILAIDEINSAGGIDGLPLIPVIRDDASDPRQFLHLADVMLREEKVNIVFGGSCPEARRTATPLFERRNGLLLYSGLGDGFDFSPNVFCFGLLPNQSCGLLLGALCQQGTKDVFVLYRDDMLSRGLRHCLMREIEHRGYCVLGEWSVSDAPSDVGAVLERIEVSKAEKVVVVLGGRDSDIITALGGGRHKPTIATVAVSERDLLKPAAAAEGLLSISTYCGTVTSVAADAFNRRHARRYGRGARPDAFCESSYCAIYLFALSAERAGSEDSDGIRDALQEVSFDAPQGRVAIDPESNCAGLWPRVLRWGTHGQFEIAVESERAAMPDPYLILRPNFGAP